MSVAASIAIQIASEFLLCLDVACLIIIMYKKYQEEREKQESLEDDKRVARDEVIVSQHWQNIERSCDQQRACPLAVTTRTGWQIVRVFVSSTFTDFHSEREVLMKKVN